MCRPVPIVALVAARVIFGQAISAPDNAPALLKQASRKVQNSLRRLPKYTCLETVERAYYFPVLEKHNPHLMTEDRPLAACLATSGGHLSLEATDRLWVEVAASEGHEIHSWPAASRFDTGPFDKMIPSGPLSTGSFGTTLLDVFANPNAKMSFTAINPGASGDSFEYSFYVPANVSHSVVKGSHKWWVTAFSGSFDIDPATAELTQFVWEPDSLPSDTGMCRAQISIDYHLIPIGDGEFLLPRRSRFHTFDLDGSQTDSVTEFSACREYAAESHLRFDDQDAPAGIVKTNPQHSKPLPPGVSLTLSLVSKIDLDTAAAGDPISAKVVHPVLAPRSKAILVPADAIARGRILVMRHELRTSEFIISIRFDTLETEGAVVPLSVRLDREIKAAKRNTGEGFSIRGTEFSLPAPASLEPGSHFTFHAKRGTYVIPAGFQSKWKTVAP